MHRARNFPLCLSGIILILLLCPIWAPQAMAQGTDKPVRIGMVDSLFTDVSPGMRTFGRIMFGGLMKETTGMTGDMKDGGDALALAKKLSDGKVDLAVFHGVEFAWAQKHFPNLRPLMVAITKYKQAQAVVVVRKENAPTAFAQLKGKNFILPLCSREHCRLFMCRCCGQCGCDNPHNFFSEIAKHNVEKALDDVCQGTSQGTVVDRVALENYKALKPGCYARLQILMESEQFPTGVIAYREGAMSSDVLTKFRTGLFSANATPVGLELMQMFGITSFEDVPASYSLELNTILKSYPSPQR